MTPELLATDAPRVARAMAQALSPNAQKDGSKMNLASRIVSHAVFLICIRMRLGHQSAKYVSEAFTPRRVIPRSLGKAATFVHRELPATVLISKIHALLAGISRSQVLPRVYCAHPGVIKPPKARLTVQIAGAIASLHPHSGVPLAERAKRARTPQGGLQVPDSSVFHAILAQCAAAQAHSWVAHVAGSRTKRDRRTAKCAAPIISTAPPPIQHPA